MVERNRSMRRCNCLRAVRSLSLVILAGFIFACTALPRHPRPSDFEDLGPGFSGQLVQAHLAALRGVWERLPGAEGDEIARAYLAREFRLSGARTDRLVGGDREHLIADLPGESRDVVLLVAAYPHPDSDSGDSVGDTGAAVLVELARVLGASEQPYGLRFALAEARPAKTESDREASSKASESAQAGDARHTARERLIEAGRALAMGIESEGGTDRIRAVIVLDLSARSSLVFARDLRSHPGFREIFWESAARLGAESMFPPDADWASPKSLQLGFRERSMDRILALVDVAMEPDARGVALSGSEEGRARALDSLGPVLVDALGRLMQRLEKVDAFSR